MKMSRKILLAILSAMALCLIIILLAAGIVLSMIFDDKATEYEPAMPDFAAFAGTQAKVMNFYNTVFSPSPPPVAEIHFSPEELGMLLSFSEGYINAKRGGTVAKLTFEDGAFRGRYAARSPLWTPFGRFVNIDCRWAPRFKDGQAAVDIRGFRAGSFTPPRFLVQTLVDGMVENEVKSSPAAPLMMSMLKRLEVEDGGVTIVYQPTAVRKLIDGGAAMNLFGIKQGGSYEKQ